jgi:hypothetical protein
MSVTLSILHANWDVQKPLIEAKLGRRWPLPEKFA